MNNRTLNGRGPRVMARIALLASLGAMAGCAQYTMSTPSGPAYAYGPMPTAPRYVPQYASPPTYAPPAYTQQPQVYAAPQYAPAYAAPQSAPCGPGLTPGRVLGGIVGGLIGSTIGGGNGRIAASALGAGVGAAMGGC